MKAPFAACVGALVVAGTLAGASPPAEALALALALAASTTTSPPVSAAAPAHSLNDLPKANPGVVGLALSGVGASLQPPTSPTDKPFSGNCHTLIDPGFTGKCVIAVAPSGTVAGVVEEETAVRGPGPAGRSAKYSGPGVQERDLVWRRQGGSWVLSLLHVFRNPGLPSLVWEDDIERDHDPKLVFVTPSNRSGFGAELDLVEGSGAVVLYRFLGQGFADVPAAGGLVTYVPGWTEQNGPENAYDQTFIRYSSGAWRVFSEQYVPDAAAQRQHRGAFWDGRAVPAK
jgi:hypothetical protein